MRNKQTENSKRRFIIILSIILLIMFGLSIAFTKTSIFMCLIPTIIVISIFIIQEKTGNNKALMYLFGLISAVICIILVVILALIAKSNDIVKQILTFPH